MFKTFLNVCVIEIYKKYIQRHPNCLTDDDYDYILDEIDRRDKIEFERTSSVNSDEEWY